MKIILKKVGQEPEIVELDIDKNNGFQVSRKFREVLGADYATDRMALDSEAGIYLYVAELGEGHTHTPHRGVYIGSYQLSRLAEPRYRPGYRRGATPSSPDFPQSHRSQHQWLLVGGVRGVLRKDRQRGAGGDYRG